jgi:hypothetical protein
MKLIDGKTQAQLDAIRDDILFGALRSQRRVFVFSQIGANRPLGIRSGDRRLEWKLIATGTDPVAITRDFPSRLGLAAIGGRRGRAPTTQPQLRSRFQIFELRLR